MLYDTLIVFAWLWFVTAIYMWGKSKTFPDTASYQAWVDANGQSQDPLLSIVIIGSLYLFYSFFWRRSGQTLGMQAWRIRIASPREANTRPSHKACLLRFIGALISFATFGLGYLWQLVDRENRSLPDLISGTKLALLPKDWHEQFQR